MALAIGYNRRAVIIVIAKRLFDCGMQLHCSVVNGTSVTMFHLRKVKRISLSRKRLLANFVDLLKKISLSSADVG
jgi:hypothetical protein